MVSKSRTTREKRSIDLKPTNVKGVYSFVPPSKGVDFRTASRRTLIKHGILMRRPDAEREPKLFALWNRFVDEIWTLENFVEPSFGPSPGITHNLKGLEPTDTYGVNTSNDWSGSMLVGSWVGVMGVWRVPMVRKPTTPADYNGQWQSSSWVGLNGGGGLPGGGFLPGTFSTDVLQAGVAQNVGTDPPYYAWYEWFVPNYEAVKDQYPYVLPLPIPTVPVNPGDEISVVIQFVQQMNPVFVPDPIPPGPPITLAQCCS